MTNPTDGPATSADVDDDPRFSARLVFTVAGVLAEHGYPALTSAQLATLLAALYHVLYGRLEDNPESAVDTVYETGFTAGQRHGEAAIRRQAAESGDSR